jgi:hypothetical protein
VSSRPYDEQVGAFRCGSHLWLSFIAASLSFVAVFAASASPIPLYEIYHLVR